MSATTNQLNHRDGMGWGAIGVLAVLFLLIGAGLALLMRHEGDRQLVVTSTTPAVAVTSPVVPTTVEQRLMGVWENDPQFDTGVALTGHPSRETWDFQPNGVLVRHAPLPYSREWRVDGDYLTVASNPGQEPRRFRCTFTSDGQTVTLSEPGPTGEWASRLNRRR